MDLGMTPLSRMDGDSTERLAHGGQAMKKG